MIKNNKVRVLKKWELEEIHSKIGLSRHAKSRLEERNGDIDEILSSKFAYVNTDGTINIAVDEYEYFVVAARKETDDYVMITYKEKSHNEITVKDKYNLALKGHSRKEEKYK